MSEPDQAPEVLKLDALSFTGPERLECQQQFDTPFGDLLQCVFEACDLRRDGPMTVQIVDREGIQHFPDQIIQFMLWVQIKRDDPDAELSMFDDLQWGDLNRAYIKGRLNRLGKASTKTNESTKSGNGEDSADSTG